MAFKDTMFPWASDSDGCSEGGRFDRVNTTRSDIYVVVPTITTLGEGNIAVRYLWKTGGLLVMWVTACASGSQRPRGR